MRLLCLLIVFASTLGAQQLDRLGEARKLYQSAEYARALSTLNDIEPTGITAEQARDRLVYQALCLLALERQPALDAKIQEIVQADPFYSPGAEISPRLRALVDEARGRMLPSLVEGHYRTGKERFDAGDHATALRELAFAVQLAESAPAGPEADALADIRLLAEGFRDLAKRALETPTPDAVVQPVVIQQDIPAWPPSLVSHLGQQADALTGVLQIVVTKTGDVGTVTLIKRIHPVYDALLVAAAKQWKYQPATLRGQPIDFVKRLNVKVSVR